MKRSPITPAFFALVAIVLVSAMIPATQAAGEKTSGQGKLRFKVLYTSEHLPAEAQKVLKSAHGGFAVDRRKGKGETYFALPGAGILQISADLKNIKLLPTAEEMKGTNMHNAMLWTAEKETYLTFPGNAANRVFTTKLDGTLVHTLKPPTADTDLGDPTVNNYFKNNGPFIPTDVEYLDGLFYIPTGYSKLDYVLTARVKPGKNFDATWNKLSFGGRGTGVGQFGTGHGVTVPVGKKRIDIADRPNSEVDRFTPEGKYLETVKLPAGSFPCDTFYDGPYMVIGALHGPDRTKGAPIYILENDKVVSTIMPKEELALANFQHIHNAVMRKVGKKLYVIAQAWNPGDFVILEQVN
ncbi:MAG: hypothetical protein HYX27_05600 [Acidobacteria bacterium]|nr:hypothetical protein [Acidobacteriota bacterium]